MPQASFSDILELPKGYYIISLESEKRPRTQELEEVKEEVSRLAKKEQAPAYAQAAAEEFMVAAENSAKSLGDFAKERELEAHSTEKLVAKMEQVTAAPPGLVERVIEFGEGAQGMEVLEDSMVVFSVDEFQESFIPEFSDVKDQVIDAYKNSKALDLAKSKASELITEIKAAPDAIASLRSVAERESLQVEETPAFMRSTANNPLFFNPLNRQQAFALKEKGSFTPEPLSDGQGAVVLGLLEVTPAAEAEFETQSGQIARSESARAGGRLFQVLVETLKKQEEIWISPDFLERNKVNA